MFTGPAFNPILAEKYPAMFGGVDKEGHPVYIERLDANNIRAVLNDVGTDALFRWHVYTLERQRQIMKHWKTDRICVVLDAGAVDMWIVTNTQAIGFLKQIATHDQAMYPEGMRRMFVVRAPAAVTLAWKVVAPLLDPVVRDKIQIMGWDFIGQLSEFLPIEHLPAELGGKGPEWYSVPCDPAEYRIPEPPNAS
eukprot:TRINITY_DN4023_c0_g1_i1.p2 TRINITY_DN4023_c0_g1~~TRINITY_DN4023_c0_g1_i1.p2  ORF type:complete len:194 (-),score=67.44 TRINITY_DN4023_c0_g1_i1:107-688(-)